MSYLQLLRLMLLVMLPFTALTQGVMLVLQCCCFLWFSTPLTVGCEGGDILDWRTVKSVVGRPTIQCCVTKPCKNTHRRPFWRVAGWFGKRYPVFVFFCVFWHFLRFFPPKMGFFACFVQGIYRYQSAHLLCSLCASHALPSKC